MKLLGLEITKVQNNAGTMTVICCHCAKGFVIPVENIRTSNYCFNCK